MRQRRESSEDQERLQASNERLRVSLAVAPLTVFHQDRALRYTWIANPVLGADAADILGKRDEDMLEPEHAARLTVIKRTTP
jgi:two-component system, cell cycle sensor histidine kinase and response regulator CckA